jgi:hypothetical protein
MQPTYHTTGVIEDESFSIKQELKKLVASIGYVLTQWKLLLLAAVLGALIGLLYRWIRPLTYTARTTFVVEESKIGGGSLASALAGQTGLDISGLTGSASSGMLAGDNVLELVKSHSLIRKTLLSAYDSGNNRSLADVYAESEKLKEKWSGKLDRTINFDVTANKFDRTTDSLLQIITDKIIESNLSIAKPDKKLGFFAMNVTMRDEKLSLLFSQRLLKATTDFYIETKTKRLANNVARLQAKADSLAVSLNRKTYSAADANRRLLDANPVYAAPEVSAEIQYRDKLVQGTIFAKIIENLEISKTALIQETPTFQIVDTPEIPLKDNRIKLSVAFLTGALIAVLLTALLLIGRRSWRSEA